MKIPLCLLFITSFLAGPNLSFAHEVFPRNPLAGAQETLRSRLEFTPPYSPLASTDERRRGEAGVGEFYHRRFFAPAWFEQERPTTGAMELLAAIRGGSADGLVPRHYNCLKIEELLAEMAVAAPRSRRMISLIADLDLLLTEAFLTFGTHLQGGRVKPASVDPHWHTRARTGSMITLLEEALERREVGAALRGLRPSARGYAGLRSALLRYRQLAAAGGWLTIPPGPVLGPGSSGPRVSALRTRLSATGDLPVVQGDFFDAGVQEAVRCFQRRHGLEVDGLVGAATLAALNVPAGERARQIEVNLERWRWLPADLGEKYLLVNIANFHLEVVEKNESVLKMRVVVGRPFRRTPVFSDRMTYLVLNPYWQVPAQIAVEDILPEVRQDVSYLERMGFKVFRGWETDDPEVDATEIDWSKLGADRWPFRLRQEPGPLNALGRIKFMFPNDFFVYLHDTPARGQFWQETRAFSSGCIRVENPLELAAYLLRGTAYGSHSEIESALAGGEELVLWLPKPVPVHLLYWTVWVDGEGMLQFRQDIYNLDSDLRLAIDHLSPPIKEQIEEQVAAPLAIPGDPET